MDIESNKRKAFRLEYLAKDMPLVEIKDSKYPVLDISATGMRLWNANGLYLRNYVSGKIHLHVGEPIEFSGTVKRVKENHASLEFIKEISWGDLIKERNYLKNKRGYNI